jgi:BirA family biotin operon repressor/biotin-[acetyl-CoA-carboxylase] ligase
VHLRSTDSTNERARALALGGAPHGTLVTADEQTSGRGRQGRAWSATPGRSLLASVLLRGLGPEHALLPLAAAVAVCEACERTAPVTCEVKWPNDVWIDRRKVAGILVEGRPQEGWAVVGVGINVSTAREELPPELREHATSLALAGAGAAPPVDRVREALCRCFDGWLLEADRHDVLHAWAGRDALRGERVRWRGGEGVADGIDEEGNLRVRTGGDDVTLAAGEVHLLKD